MEQVTKLQRLAIIRQLERELADQAAEVQKVIRGHMGRRYCRKKRAYLDEVRYIRWFVS